MKSFFFVFLRNLFALSSALAVLIILFFVFIGAAFSLFLEKPLAVKDDSFLLFDLSTKITDAPVDDFFASSAEDLFNMESSSTASVLEVLHAFEAAADDDRITGLVLKETLADSGLPMLREIRQGIETFKKSGKPVIAYLENPTKYDLFIASVSDHIILNPFSQVSLQGLAAQRTYLGDAFKKYGVGFQTTRVGKYKSAVEMFEANKMSEADREQTELLLKGSWADIVTVIGEGRDLTVDAIQKISDEYGLLHALEAKKFHLVDDLGYYDNLVSYLLKVSDHEDENSIPFVGVSRYARSLKSTISYSKASEDDPSLAIVYADGEIVEGSGGYDNVGSDKLMSRLRKLREDDSVKAVVFRVNSPGGSAYASELIQREVQLLNKEKPVVVSFGDVAASGGYWISCYSRAIFADPSTLTGSIGVFALIFNAHDIANNYGVTFDSMTTGPFADIEGFYNAKTPEQMERLQQLTDFTYSAFLFKVSDGRNISMDQAREAAEGRVWLAKDAKEYGLIDRFGGIQDAINYAAELGELEEDYQVIQMPHRGDYSEDLLGSFKSGSDEAIARVVGLPEVKRFHDDLKFLTSFQDPKHMYARQPFHLRFW